MMRNLTHQTVLRSQVEAAVEAAFQQLGERGFEKGKIVVRFRDQGASLATIYRWIDGYVAKANPGPRMAKKLQRDAVRLARQRVLRGRAASGKTQSEVVAVDANRSLTTLPVLMHGTQNYGIASALSGLEDCIAAAQQVMRYARTEAGEVRMAKTLLNASEHLSRSVERLVKLQDTIHNVSEIDRFHQEILVMLKQTAAEFPQLVPIILSRLRSVAQKFQSDAGRETVHPGRVCPVG